MSPSHPIRQARIDVPLRSLKAYFFIEPSQRQWHPWWGALWEHLMALAPTQPDWTHNAVQDVLVARPVLTQDQKEKLVRFLRTAPPQEIEGHRTLRRAVRLRPDDVPRLDVLYFAGPVAVLRDPFEGDA